MEDIKKPEKSFLLGLCITLGTIVIGLISYIFYASNIAPKAEVLRCEYNGWAYSDQQTFKSTDGCNTCFCDDGKTICTDMACTTTPTP